MIFSMPHLVKMVREEAGFSQPRKPLFDGCPPQGLPLDRFIENSLPAAIRSAYAEAPPALLQGLAVSMAHCGVFWHDARDSFFSGHVLLPPDFFSLAVFEMSDWATAVYEAVDCRSSRYLLTSSRFAALRGVPSRPVAALAQYPEGLALEFFSCSSSSCTISKAAYIPLPALTDDCAIDIPTQMLQPIIGQASRMLLAHPAIKAP